MFLGQRLYNQRILYTSERRSPPVHFVGRGERHSDFAKVEMLTSLLLF